MLRSINRWILMGEIVVGTAMLGVATSAITLEVICRYFLRFPLNWTIELAMFLLNWITFLGASILLKRKGHIRVSLLLDALSYKARTLIGIFLDMLIVLALAIMFYYGITFFHIHNVTRTVTLHIPRGYFALPLILASLSMILFSIQSIWDQAISLKKGM